MKKAQGISLTMLIIAVIALIVLVVIIAIFTGKMPGISTGLQSCANKGGSCAYPDNAPCPDGMAEVSGTDCEAGRKCCIRVLEEPKT